MSYTGVIIEESLRDVSILEQMKKVETHVVHVTERHKTPWLKQWTLHTVEIPEEKVEEIAAAISQLFDAKHSSWYADFKNDTYHFIIYPHKIFMVTIANKKEYEEAYQYGLSLGIPEYQLVEGS